jgi:hypothetical protein
VAAAKIPFKGAALVATTQQNLSNPLFLDIHGEFTSRKKFYNISLWPIQSKQVITYYNGQNK